MRIEDAVVRNRLEIPHGSWNSEEGLRDSAVLAMLVEKEGEDRLIFNRRRDDLPFHPGQVCFPGGTADEGEDAVACALRETCEEMGIPHDKIEVLGRMADRVSIAGFKVACFAGRLTEPLEYHLNVAEVAEAFEVPCKLLLEPDRWGYRTSKHKLARFRSVPYFNHDDGNVVWGLTGIILRDFVQQVMGWAPPVG
ncbi:MAG: NUDIX hydrolase [Planctomycetota bacterium]|jgi:8-oxo-dGTP pyrophosphatase MutT (NUDIX family)